MEPKVINNTSIFQAKQNILGAINSELQKGTPISVICMIVENILPELNMTLQQVMQSEQEAANKSEENKEDKPNEI